MGRPRKENPVVNHSFYVKADTDLFSALNVFSSIFKMSRADFVRSALWRGLKKYYDDLNKQLYFAEKALPTIESDELKQVSSHIEKLKKDISELEKFIHNLEFYDL